ncbi:MAG: hypothetical protein LBS48_02140 [Treponema sp.]|jgi:hypothetical protein|nr:hypothetical protein [Treponema sp.]
MYNGIEKDRAVLRELAKQVAEIAALPVQEEKKRLWRAYVAVDILDAEIIRKDLLETKETCRRHAWLPGIHPEGHQHSTIHNEPEQLQKWADIALEVAQ